MVRIGILKIVLIHGLMIDPRCFLYGAGGRGDLKSLFGDE